jgi:glyoxylase-like metal-dependent hydrolase (beta-lactamase superfamily II)
MTRAAHPITALASVGRKAPAYPQQVAERVYRLGTKWINFHLIENDGEFTLVDAGYPSYWRHLVAATDALGTSPQAIKAVILTHHHADHVGTAERLRATAGARMFVGAGDAWIAAGRYPSHANPGFYRDCWWRPNGIGFLAHSAVSGGAKYRPIGQLEDLRDDRILDVPGRPLVIRTPGHTAGHSSVALPERGVLLAGDALANLDYATGRRAIGLHRFNDDRQTALASLSRLDGIDAETVLFGHGEPWTGGLDRALELARAATHN